LSAGQFKFRLLTATNIEVETAQNQADGSITFSPLKFIKAGTYTYFIRESVPLPADSHITYDLKTVTAVIEVTDNHGILEAEGHYTPENKFVNLFSYSPTETTIQMKKILTGMQLTTGMFTFELKDLSTGTTVSTGNLSNGDILFYKTYSEPGSYQYQVQEVIPYEPMKYMNYDDKIITVTVTVSDDGTGNLVASVSYSEDPEFFNSYKVQGRIW
jgi:pilin isopeptide linkage protein